MATSVFNALGHPLRRKVMMVLRKGPKTSGDLAGMFDASWPTVSRHLNVLKEADLRTRLPRPPNPRGGKRRPPGHSGPYRRN